MPFSHAAIEVIASPDVRVSPLPAGEGVLVEIPEGCLLAEPIRLRIDPSQAARTAVRVHAGQGSKAVIVEEIRGGGAGEWAHAVDIEVAEEGKLDYASLQMASLETPCHIAQRSTLASGAGLAFRNVTLGGREVEHSVHSTVSGNDAVSDVDWMFFGTQKDRFRLSCRNEFSGRNGGGEVTMKGVARDTASVACNGLIAIGLQGGGTNTYLTQSVLMLDPTAKIDAVPGLEIKTNDVKASHSATIARVTPEDLFYFGSRGIAQQDARHLYVMGFLGAIAEKMPYAKDAVLAAIEAKGG